MARVTVRRQICDAVETRTKSGFFGIRGSSLEVAQIESDEGG